MEDFYHSRPEIKATKRTECYIRHLKEVYGEEQPVLVTANGNPMTKVGHVNREAEKASILACAIYVSDRSRDINLEQRGKQASIYLGKWGEEARREAENRESN